MLLLATMIAYAPVFWHGYPAGAWDSRYHAVTARMFSNQLWSGDIYPRWLMAMNSGLGSPHFFYYSPLSYYIASAFDWFGASTAVPQLGAAAVLLGFASGITSYLWLSRLMPHHAALTGAIFYLASPFHVFVDLYVRADYAEFAAMTFSPVVFLGVELVRERRAIGLAIVGLGLATVVLTHVVIGLIFAGIPVLYMLARCEWQPGWRRDAALVFLAGLLGLGISGFYLVPALAYRPDVVMPVVRMATDKFIFGGSPKPMLILFIWLMFLGYTVLLLILFAWWRWLSTERWDNLTVTCFVAAATSLTLTTVWARPLWLLLPILAVLQFTYRLFVLVDLCVAALLGSFVAAATARLSRSGLVNVVRSVILLIAAGGAATAVWAGCFNYDAGLWNQRIKYADDYGLFRPKTVQVALPADQLPLYNGGDFGPDLALPPRIQVVRGQADVRVLQWRPRRIIVDLVAQTPGQFVIGQLYVPGWQGIDNPSGEHLSTTPSDGQGLVMVSFAKGTWQISISLLRRMPELVGILLSILSLLGLAAVTLGAQRGPTRQTRPCRLTMLHFLARRIGQARCGRSGVR